MNTPGLNGYAVTFLVEGQPEVPLGYVCAASMLEALIHIRALLREANEAWQPTASAERHRSGLLELGRVQSKPWLRLEEVVQLPTELGDFKITLREAIKELEEVSVDA